MSTREAENRHARKGGGQAHRQGKRGGEKERQREGKKAKNVGSECSPSTFLLTAVSERYVQLRCAVQLVEYILLELTLHAGEVV